MDIKVLQAKYETLAPALTERSRRLWAATEALALGHGGIALVARATGIAHSTISRGIQELKSGETLSPDRSRRPGGGRKRTIDKDIALLADLEALLEPTTAGLPDAPLRWTSKSTRKLAAELQAMGHTVSHRLVAELLHELGYTLQAHRKTREGTQHPDRDAQFQYLNDQVHRRQKRGDPVISVDTKKKELVGDFKNPGRDWRPKGSPERVRVHDFLIPEQGKAIPYGVYDLTRDEGWVSVGIDHDTARFAVNAIRSWWQKMGRLVYGGRSHLLITADAGGSNGPKIRLWKCELQKFANRTGLSITVCHYPPGTSKWNKIEHRLFSHIAVNWRAKALTSLAAIVSLIGSTTTKTGLRVRSEIDKRPYPKGVAVSDDQMAQINLKHHNIPASPAAIPRMLAIAEPAPRTESLSLSTPWDALRAFRFTSSKERPADMAPERVRSLMPTPSCTMFVAVLIYRWSPSSISSRSASFRARGRRCPWPSGEGRTLQTRHRHEARTVWSTLRSARSRAGQVPLQIRYLSTADSEKAFSMRSIRVRGRGAASAARPSAASASPRLLVVRSFAAVGL